MATNAILKYDDDDVILEIQLSESARIYLKNNPAKLHPDPIWNESNTYKFWKLLYMHCIVLWLDKDSVIELFLLFVLLCFLNIIRICFYVLYMF